MAETAVRKLSMEFDDAPKNTPLDARVQSRVEKAGLHMTSVLHNAISEAAALSDFMKMKGELSDQKRILKGQVAREKFLSYLSQGDSLKLDIMSQQSAVDELASTYRKTKQVTAQQCSAIAEKISKAALAFEQMCEDMKQFEEEVACDAHEVESEAAAKQIGLLQGMLQQASNELADLQEKSGQLQSEHEARVNAAAAASAAAERASKEPRMARYAQWLQQALPVSAKFTGVEVKSYDPLQSSVLLLLVTPQCPDVNLTLEIAPDGALKAASASLASPNSSDNLPPFDDLIHDAIESSGIPWLVQNVRSRIASWCAARRECSSVKGAHASLAWNASDGHAVVHLALPDATLPLLLDCTYPAQGSRAVLGDCPPLPASLVTRIRSAATAPSSIVDWAQLATATECC